MKYTRTHIEETFNKGKRLKYLFFWGHSPNKDGSIGKSCFSQWWSSNFIVDGITYKTAEHWMMAEKARLFKDAEYLLSTKQRIIVEASPRDRIWGIGMGQHNEKAENPNLWRGQNLLGFALMEVRDELSP